MKEKHPLVDNVMQLNYSLYFLMLMHLSVWTILVYCALYRVLAMKFNIHISSVIRLWRKG